MPVGGATGNREEAWRSGESCHVQMPGCGGCCYFCPLFTWDLSLRCQSSREARNTDLYTTRGEPKRTAFVTLAEASPCGNVFILPTCYLLAVLLAFARGLIRQRATPTMLPYSVRPVKLLLRRPSVLLNDSSYTETQLAQSLEWDTLCLFDTRSQFIIGLGLGRFDSFIQ